MTLRPPPLWQTIAATLRDELSRGHFRAGDKLPTEAVLGARFGVNRHTVRRALADLATDGLVQARRGAGVFVTVRPTDYAIGNRVRFHQNLTAAGRIPGKRILAQTTRPADAAEAAALRLTSGTAVHVCDGLSLADGTPIAVFRSVFPAARFPDLPADLAELTSVTAALARAGITDYTRASTRLSARLADGVQARHLNLAPGAPLLLSLSVNVGPDGGPVEYGQTWFAGDRVTLTLEPGDMSSN